MFHYRQRKIDSLIPNLKINSVPIERVTEFNFLGLTIDEQLSWSPHIQKISNKIYLERLALWIASSDFYLKTYYVSFTIL